MSARLIVCADDFGRNANIDGAILGLARDAKAVSVMVGEPNISRSAPALPELAGEVAIGLHLTFVDGMALGSHANFARDDHLPSIDRSDPIGAARAREFDDLSQTSVRHLARDAGRSLGRFRR